MTKQEKLDKRADEMRERQRERNTQYKRKSRIQEQLKKLAGAELRVEVITAADKPVSQEIKDIVARLKDAVGSFVGLTPEQIADKVTALTQVLHIKLQLQVNESLDKLDHANPGIRDEALQMITTLLPFITQITELNVKMQLALGIAESKTRMVGPQRRQVAAPSASPDAWEKSFGDTLTNKAIN